ncbi:MAG: hypothetical protein CMJ69_03260 [Planctomycetaceae bacterium]|nr:hypothetical protein [Planctomycetaceae bacterium]
MSWLGDLAVDSRCRNCCPQHSPLIILPSIDRSATVAGVATALQGQRPGVALAGSEDLRERLVEQAIVLQRIPFRLTVVEIERNQSVAVTIQDVLSGPFQSVVLPSFLALLQTRGETTKPGKTHPDSRCGPPLE